MIPAHWAESSKRSDHIAKGEGTGFEPSRFGEQVAFKLPTHSPFLSKSLPLHSQHHGLPGRTNAGHLQTTFRRVTTHDALPEPDPNQDRCSGNSHDFHSQCLVRP